MSSYPKIRAAVRMPDGTTVEVSEQLATATGSVKNYVLRDKNTLHFIASSNSFTRIVGEIYGRVKAMEDKIEKAKKENKQYCANCQCLLEL